MIYLLPIVTVFLWGGNTIVNKLASTAIEPSAMSFYRWFVAMLIFTPFCLPRVIRRWASIRPYLGKIALLSLLGMVLNQSLGYYAGLTTTASNMALITSLVPLMSVLLSVPLLGKRLSLLSVGGALLSLLGLAYMLGAGDVLFFTRRAVSPGDAMMLLSALSYAAYCVLLKRWTVPFDNASFIYMQGMLAVLMLTPLWLSSEQLLPSQQALPLIAYAAIAASIVAPLLWVKSIARLGADSSAMFMNLLPVITVTLAVLLLDETLHDYHLLGGALVLAGVSLAQIKVRRPANSRVSQLSS
ncbi:DMT family transporter [Vibrio sp.]|uniref:DMT family transporter n=1 Tax=Vibrio sp. TaxID=678 RepID=UPI003D0E0233